MKIGFDAKRVFFNRTGLGNYSRKLLTDLAEVSTNDDLLLFTPEVSEKNLFYERFSKSPFTLTEISSFKRSLNLSATWKRTGIDIYHGLSNELPFFIGRSSPRLVVTIHDLLFEDYPEDYPLMDRKIYRQKVKNACEKSDLIIAVSQATADDLVERYSVDKEKIVVHYQSCHNAFLIPTSTEHIESTRKRHQLNRPYLLCVSSLSTRKNQLALVDAYAKSRLSREIDLIFVGTGLLRGQLLDRIEAHGLASKCRLIQIDSIEELSLLYRGAFASIYPSLKEGFGIPILEGFASEIPVLTSDRGSMAEIGSDAVISFNPEDSGSMTTAIDRLFDEDLKKKCVLKGSLRLKDFGGHQLARMLSSLYKRLL